MLKLAACLVLIAGCVTEETGSTEQDVHGDADGWGMACYDPNTSGTDRLYNTCVNVNGETGICSSGICRRQCASPELGGCPKHYDAVFIVGNGCYCERRLDEWDQPNLSPAIEW